MSSWALFHHLTAFWKHTDNPIFRQATAHPPAWAQWLAQWARESGAALMLVGIGCYLCTVLANYGSVLIPLALLMALWVMLVGLALAPVIVTEVERATWEMLRCTPLTTDRIVLGKAGGALWWLRTLLRILGALLVVAGLGIGVGRLMLANPIASLDQETLPFYGVCAITGFVPLAITVIFLLDRAQQFVLIAAATLAVSASSHSVRAALAGGIMMSVMVWLADIGIAWMVLALLSPHALNGSRPLLPVVFGSSASYITALPLGGAALLCLGTLAVREILVRLVWGWTMRAAQRV